MALYRVNSTIMPVEGATEKRVQRGRYVELTDEQAELVRKARGERVITRYEKPGAGQDAEPAEPIEPSAEPTEGSGEPPEEPAEGSVPQPAEEADAPEPRPTALPDEADEAPDETDDPLAPIAEKRRRGKTDTE